MPKPLPTPELLRKLLRYESNTGKMFWRERTPDMFEDGGHTARHSCAAWNAKMSGRSAMIEYNDFGYMRGQILGNMHFSHRVAWAIHYGEWPDGGIDHINHVKDDNRIVNLRLVSHKSNMQNQRIRSTNTSGALGVHLHKASGKWRACIMVNGKSKHLGLFNDKEVAIAVRQIANIEYGYHENHGKNK